MSKKTTIRKEKRVMLTDEELIEKYEKGAQPQAEALIGMFLSKPSPSAPVKKEKKR